MSSKIQDLLNNIDPSKFRCRVCHQWKDVELYNEYNNCCTDCKPRPDFSNFAMPLMRQVFPKTITKDLVSVQPMDKIDHGKTFYLKTERL